MSDDLLSGKNQVQWLEQRIADLEKRWPAHSVPPAMMQELDELEELLGEARSRQQREEDDAQADNRG